MSRRTSLRTPRQLSRSCTVPGRTAQPSIRPSVSTTAWRLRPLTPAFAGAGSSGPHHSRPDRSGGPPFGPFHALAVHDGGRGAGLLAGQLTGLLIEGVVQAT